MTTGGIGRFGRTPYAKVRRYRICTYDVCGNARDGWEVNNVFRSETTVDIRCKRKTFNGGTEHEFHDWHPTDSQINRAIGEKGLRWESNGAEGTLYGETASGKPFGELEYVGTLGEDLPR